MRYKVFLTAFISTVLAVLPGESFTCAETEDPQDYFTSFFSNRAGTGNEYKPFYYTALLTFYDDNDWDEPVDSLSFIDKNIVEEWAAYGKAEKPYDATQLVYLITAGDIEKLLVSIRDGKPLPAPLAKNSVAQNLVKEKKTEAVNYLLFADESSAQTALGSWQDARRDSVSIAALIEEANKAYQTTTDAFIKTKYGFQLCKLAFYSNRHADCIRWYNEAFTNNTTAAVASLALSYKGGSEYRLGKNEEAAYTFSKVFALTAKNKKGAYQGFLWSTNYANPSRFNECLALCKTAGEKANMTGLFALYGTGFTLESLRQVYDLMPSSPLLPLLATREINKLEEQYFTEVLVKENGGKPLYIHWDLREDGSTKPVVSKPAQVIKTAVYFEKLAAEKALPNRALYAAGAAYLHFMAKAYPQARAAVTMANSLNPDAKVKDQLSLINLLLVANEGKTITAETEAQMLPAMKWLTEKAQTDKEYQVFCRNFFSEVLAQKYEQQADAPKAALAYGLADLSFIRRGENDYYYSYPPAIDFVRNEMSTSELLKLYGITTAPQTETQKFMVQHSSVKRDGVVDVIGTSYLRDRAYAKVIEWLSKARKLPPMIEAQYNYETGNETKVNVDPLFDYLNDWQRLGKAAAKPYTKLTLAQKLLELQTKAESSMTTDRARTCYQLASALYNMSYYGNSWSAVAYDRSSSDWNEGNYAQPWQTEYYGVYKAREYYQKAYELAGDKEFKAACLFMVAKCAQRQLPMPAYDYKNYELNQTKEDEWSKKFKNNPLFSKFKTEFGTTKFYQYAYNRCSYLRDYVSTPAKPTARPKKG